MRCSLSFCHSSNSLCLSLWYSSFCWRYSLWTCSSLARKNAFRSSSWLCSRSLILLKARNSYSFTFA
jgi:hypothetical protein